MTQKGSIYRFEPDPKRPGSHFLLESVDVQKPATTKLSTQLFVFYAERVFDMIIFVITCREHHNILLQQVDRNLYFLPFSPFNPCNSWLTAIADRLNYFLKNLGIDLDSCSQLGLMQLNQVKISRFNDILYQLFVNVEISGGKSCCQSNNFFKWSPINQLSATNLWGPEPSILAVKANRIYCYDLSSTHELKWKRKKWNLLMDIDVSESDILKLFTIFMHQVFPSHFMNFVQFEDFLKRTDISLLVNSRVYDIQRMFQTICTKNRDYFSFSEFILTLTAINRKCTHGSVGGELRTRSMFRFYAREDSTSINYNELCLFYEDILVATRSTDKAERIVDELFKTLKISKNQSIHLENFVELIGNLVIRGTASIFRSETNQFQELRATKAFDVMISRLTTMTDFGPKANASNNPACSGCRKRTYRVISEPVSFSLTASLQYEASLRERTSEKSIHSSSKSQLTFLRDVLRNFAKSLYGFPNIDGGKLRTRWERKNDRIGMTDLIVKICDKARQLFAELPRVIRVQSPIYVFGDIHGNLQDLMVYDHHLWQKAPSGYVCNTLFLGDYVDRGDNSIECILYLLVLKLLLPNKFHMIRGNHESRVIQTQFTFYKECLEKFALKSGEQIWECVNTVFDNMPVCAIIDEKIFCSHGGIPTSGTKVEQLYSIPVPMSMPNYQSKMAWELMWNDPVTTNEFKEYLKLFNLHEGFPDYRQGFLANSKRGTGFYFCEDALDNFLNNNNYLYIIRAHEVIPLGFQLQMSGKLIWIFSCSNYCGGVNEAAAVYIEDRKIRIVKLETFNN